VKLKNKNKKKDSVRRELLKTEEEEKIRVKER